MVAGTPFAGSRKLERERCQEAQIWLARAREFADEIVRPVGQLLDRIDSQAAVAPQSPLFDFLAQAHREGFTRLTDRAEDGGIGLSRETEYAVLEELASADAGLAAVLIAAPLPFRWAREMGGSRLAEELALPYFSLERADWSGCCAAAGRVRCTARGDGWLLDGSTSGWVTGAATATHALLACAIELDAGLRYGLAIVPLDRPGVRRGPALDLLGLRAQARARLLLDRVWLASDELLLEGSSDASLVGAARAHAHAAAALVALGIGRAAYEGTLRLMHEDAFEGRALVEHDDVRRGLLRMLTLLESARSIAKAVHVSTGGRLDAREGRPIQHAAPAHAIATEAVLEIVDWATVLCGGRAEADGAVQFLDGSFFHPEKLLRDAQSYKVARPAGARPAQLAAAHH